MTIDAQGRLLVADNGPRQQVLIFTRDGGAANKYRESSALGERGGIFSGVAGRPGPQRFNGLTGVGVDAAGNVYVSTNGIGVRQGSTGAGLGATLESYAPDGRQLWQVQGLLFVDGAWMDPGASEQRLYRQQALRTGFVEAGGTGMEVRGFLVGAFQVSRGPEL